MMADAGWHVVRIAGREFKDGSRTFVDLGNGEAEGARNRISAALDLVRRTHPIGWVRVQRYLSRILLFDTGSPGYISFLRAVLFGKAELEKASLEQIALVLTHEATHARLHRLKITPARFTERRIEQACLKRELALARCLPQSDQWIAFVRAKETTEWWSEEDHIRRKTEALENEGAPRFLIRVTEALERWRVGREK